MTSAAPKPLFDRAPTIETPRLILRAFRAGDVEDFCANMANDEFAAFITKEGRGLAYGESWQRFSSMVGHWVGRGYGNFAVEEKASGKFVGHVGPMNPPGWPDFEIGWGIFPEYQGKGYATEAAAAAFRWSHDVLGRNETLHMIDDANEPSQQVARAMGAVPGEIWMPFWPDAKPVRKWCTTWEAFTASTPYARITENA
jgi:RimJ/RimL family protein N-acetyltransferase